MNPVGNLVFIGIIFNFTFPDDYHFNARIQKQFLLTRIIFDVFLKLGFPEGQIGFRCIRVFTVCMAMPETAMDKDGGIILF